MLINRIKQKLSSQFIRNVGWLGGAELVNRIFRLGTTVTLARLLSPYDYGLAAVVLTTNEFANVFTLRAGIGSKLIQADEQDVKVLCDTAYWMNWILGGALFIIQCAAAFPIAWFYRDNQVILPICVAAIVYLMLPIFAVQSAMIQRENRLNITALCNVTQSVLGNILTIVLALLGMGMWAIILPIVLTAPVWIVINLMNHPWRPTTSFTLKRWQEIANFARNILGGELLDKLRANLDYLLVGRFLGVDALGIYFFAFNAGLGISLNVINSLTWPLFPHLCAVRGNFKQFKERYFNSLKTIALVIVPLVLLQSSLAPFYVPIVFGQKWVTAIPILILICLSALPRPFANAASQILLAVDKTHINLYWNLIFTVFFALSLLVAAKWGIFWVAASVLITHMVAMPIFTVWASRYVFATNLTFLSVKKS
jgi:PST family polysaccharide transporter